MIALLCRPALFLGLLFLAILSPPTVRAGHPAVPGGAAMEGTGSTEVTTGFFEGTFQNIYADLAGGLGGSGLKVGDTITGISLRLDSSQTTFGGITYGRFDIRMGLGKANLVTNFASNFFGPVPQVRTGPLTLFSGDMPTTGTPRSFGKVIEFDTPYLYTGGNLLIEIRLESPFIYIPAPKVDTIDTGNKAGMVSDNTDSDSTTGTISVGPAWAMAFEVIRGGKPALVNVNIPNGAAEDGDNALIFNTTGERVDQYQYKAAQLPNLNPGDQICGFCFRRDDTDLNTLPITWERFDVRIGRSAAVFQTGAGAPFAGNFASPPAQARSGPLTLFIPFAGTSPRPFGGFVAFGAPYSYTGGDLVIEIRRKSVSGVGLKIDSAGVGNFRASGFGDADATTITSGGLSSSPILQLKVIKPAVPSAPVTAADPNAAQKSALETKIKKLKKKIKLAKKAKNKRKVQALSKKLKKLLKQLRAL